MTIKLWSILGNSQKLDGGAMFGNAPRALWSRWITPDADNSVPLACRALLATGLGDASDKRVLFETGIGAFFFVVALVFVYRSFYGMRIPEDK